MSFGLYATGFAIVIAGLIYGAYLMHIPGHWIAVGAIVLLGVGKSHTPERSRRLTKCKRPRRRWVWNGAIGT
jgi:hypothetical protein